MDDNTAGLLIICAGLAAMVWLRYLKYLKAKVLLRGGLDRGENAALEQMARTALRLEQRIASLEKILDHDMPSWRGNPNNLYQQAEKT